MEIKAKPGRCTRCDQPNKYDSYTCRFCGARLLWADAAAAHWGELCPQCSTPNTYTHMNCESCGAELPWSACPAARHHATVDVIAEQKSKLTFIILVGALLVYGFMAIMASSYQRF
jgi:hypothetical protein